MILNLARKELKSMFASPMAWVILSVLIFAFATYFINAVTQYFSMMDGSIQSNGRIGVTLFVGQSLFGLASFVMLFVVPLLSMRLIAEERRTQTLTFLLSAPISLTEIVLGKFLGLMAFLMIIITVITAMLLTLNHWTELDFGYIFSNVLGLFLLVASFSALGLYFSSITAQPVIAGLLTFIALFALLGLDQFLAADSSNPLSQMLQNLSLMRHFEPLSQGIIDSKDIIFFLLFTGIFLIFTLRRLNAERLRA
ncbi:ABC transporter permease [Methylotenera sp.]|jgi:ABC-2 type transport system permease protein|uniref:ABC transporter permease n=1 Tax=Methylotenera sp. TaxID=2051956 RepID=UPI002729031E|nr:ABC transporter permease subunit [Methylotenera sp.]MDO9203931.1 ABC transporter permease subunit [Methylotenera sp.]MDO9393219.1 ABC transporter permease subunit [Methylotenera sp.]MDP1522440.1 ABC transporter permease subunit [Methylotenera sp.]MDP2072470.1 ABC transporter permease subunit [Methylotenera sp.]MDP2229501.1 ABC transporter permease subunit [Methylotenera sp.]